MNKMVTVFTPAYNRAYTLGRLYDSLKRQTCKNFIWYVINDGSTDNTDDLMKSFIEENQIEIKYQLQQNHGKHYAHNVAAKNSDTELFFCVDSDDYLSDDAIELICDMWGSFSEEHKAGLSGIVAYRAYQDGSLCGNEFPETIIEDSLSDLYRLGKTGDTALIFRTDILRQFPFPVFEGERFLREHLAYIEIDEHYNLYVMRKAIYICEYLKDGLSKNATKLEWNSPKGAALARLYNLRISTSFTNKIRNLGAYVLFSIRGKDIKNAIAEIGIIKFILLLPIAFIGYLKYIVQGSLM